jgi:hypothetical protein
MDMCAATPRVVKSATASSYKFCYNKLVGKMSIYKASQTRATLKRRKIQHGKQGHLSDSI